MREIETTTAETTHTILSYCGKMSYCFCFIFYLCYASKIFLTHCVVVKSLKSLETLKFSNVTAFSSIFIVSITILVFPCSLVNQSMSVIDPGQTRRIIYEALSVWSKNSKLNFREVVSADADIQILFAK